MLHCVLTTVVQNDMHTHTHKQFLKFSVGLGSAFCVFSVFH